MKKVVITAIVLLPFFSFRQTQKQRYYQFAVPEDLAKQTVFLIQGHSNQVSAADARVVEDYIVNEYLQQSRKFYVEDSTEAAKQKGKH